MIRRAGFAVGTVLAAGLLTVLSTTAALADDTPKSTDPRAQAFSGNVTTCADAGLEGDEIQVGFEIDESGTTLNITSVPDGTELTGIVVKGGPAYHVYPADALTDLISPLNRGGNVPQISHWFACGKAAEDQPTSTPTQPTMTTPPPGATEPPASSEEPDAQPTKTEDEDTDDELAATGFGMTGPLLGGAAALLLAGAGLLLVMRRRASRS